MTEKPTIHCAKGTPPLAVAVIKDFYSQPILPLELRTLLELLADDNAMIEVWEKLPKEHAGTLICGVFSAFAEACNLTPPKPLTSYMTEEGQKEWHEYWEKRFPTTLKGIAVLARLLKDDMAKTDYFCSRWPELWPGDPSIDLNKFLALLESAAVFYERLDVEQQKVTEQLDILPQPTKKRAALTQRAGAMREDPKQIYFSQCMSHFMEKQFNQSLDGTVAVLTQVVFNLSESIGEDTIRRRRESFYRKVISKN